MSLITLNGRITIAEIAPLFWDLTELADSPPEWELGFRVVMGAFQAMLVGPTREITIEPQHETEIGYRLDYLLATEGTRAAFECDGLAYHGSQEAFARDRKRDRDLAAIGIESYRFTAVEITSHPIMVQREVFRVISTAWKNAP